MNKKNIFLWTLYDFANSIATIVFFLYFSQWLVVDHGVSDFCYNMIFAFGSLLLLVTAPIFGSIADRTGQQLSYLVRITLLVFVFYISTSVVALFFPGKIFLAILFYLIANYLYQFSFVFYNALLHSIAPREKWGTVSGIGQTGNWLGQIVGLVVTLPFATGAIYLIGEPGRAQTFLPALVLFMILALPMLFFFRLPKEARPSLPTLSYRAEYRNQWTQFKSLVRSPGMGMFLLSYFFFNDAILTAANNFPIYLQQVFGVSDNTKSLLLMSILFTSAIGALFSGYVTDKIGIRKSLFIVLGCYLIIFPVLGITQDFRVFVVFTIFMGFFYGSLCTVTRTAMTALCPKEKLNFGFSFYTLAERVSTLVGPLTWGLITWALMDLGPIRYRIGIVAMTAFVVVGLVLLRKVEFHRQQ